MAIIYDCFFSELRVISMFSRIHNLLAWTTNNFYVHEQTLQLSGNPLNLHQYVTQKLKTVSLLRTATQFDSSLSIKVSLSKQRFILSEDCVYTTDRYRHMSTTITTLFSLLKILLKHHPLFYLPHYDWDESEP